MNGSTIPAGVNTPVPAKARVSSNLRVARLAASIAGTYFVVAAAWIFFSDHALEAIAPRVATMAMWQTAKGWMFVGITALLLFLMLRRTFRRLRASEERLRAIITTEPECVKLVSPTGRLLEMNPAGLAMLQAGSLEEAQQRPLPEYLNAEWRAAFRELHERVMRGETGTLEFEITGLGGARRWMETRATPLRDAAGQVEALLGVARDVTARKQAEEELRRSNRALRTVSECNQLLVHATEEKTLLDGVCRLLIEHGGYRMAWVGFAEQDEARTVRPVAQAGFEPGYLGTVNISWADAEHGRGPTGTAIRTGRHVIARNIPADPAYSPWRAAAIQRGYASSIALPLNREGTPLGALMVYAAEPAAFNGAEVALLSELAGDLAYGLAALRTRAERERAEEALRQSQALLRVVTEGTPDAIYVKDTQGRYLMANAGTLHFLGKTQAEVIGQDDTALFPSEDARQIMAGDRCVMDSGAAQTYEEQVTIRGEPRTFLSTKGPLRDGGGRVAGLFGIARDITGRRKTETALRQERDFSNAVLDALPGVFYCYDESLKFRRWNRNFERVTGYRGEEIARMSPLDFFAGTERDLLAASIREVFDRGEAAVEADFVSKNGARTRYYFTGVTTELGGRRHLVGVGIDISARRQAEAERQKFVLLADSSSEFIGMCDFDFKPIYVNPAGVRMVGLPDMAAACRVKVQDYFFPEDQRFITEEFFPRVLRDGHGDVEIRLRHFQTGEPIWMFYYLFSVRNAAGAIVGWATVSRNITERKQAEAALRESEERLRLALDAARMGTFDWDVPGNRITWSRWHAELWGFKPGDFGGNYESFTSRVHPDDLPGINAEVARCIAAQAPFAREFRVVWPDASEHWILGTGEFTFDAAGQAVRMRGTVKEITERKHLERALHELTARTLRLQDEERRRIARDLHDTTAQNLAALNMNLAVIESGLPADDARARELLADCQTLTDRSAQEIRTLAYLLHPPLLEEFGLVRAVRDYAEGFGQRSGLRVKLEMGDEIERLAPDDELALFRVLQEALGNVARHSGSPVVCIRLSAESGGISPNHDTCVETRNGGPRASAALDAPTPKAGEDAGAPVHGTVTLEVADEGRGLPVESGAGVSAVGVGILGMRERLQQLGGRLELLPGLPGVRVRATLPLRRPAL